MNENKIDRRLFIRTTTLAATALTLGAKRVFAGSGARLSRYN